jgi:kinesin family protein 18/19
MGGKRSKDQPFTFDRVFDDNTTQAEVYEATTKNLLDSVFDGYNATVFAYGATGCGKTHTITYVATQETQPVQTLTRRAEVQRSSPVSSS